MFYQEQIVDGVLCYRHSPTSKWTPFTAKELTTRLAYAEECLKNCREALNVYN